MQTADQLLASPLPVIRHARGTSHPSVSNEYLHERFIHLWTTFEDEIRSALAALDLNFQVPHVDFTDGEVYLVGNGIGLSARFINNVCEPVAKVLSRASQPSVVIGDIQAFEVETSDIIPDISIGVTFHNDDSQSAVKIVAELKTFWTVALARFSVSSYMSRTQLAPYLGMYSSPRNHATIADISTGQLVAQMRKFELRYGFLSTYQEQYS